MTHELPIPEAARSPYPLHPAPILRADSAEASPSGMDAAEASPNPAETAEPSWSDKARDAIDRAGQSKVALGAAVGIGSAALLAALLYTSRSRAKGRRTQA